MIDVGLNISINMKSMTTQKMTNFYAFSNFTHWKLTSAQVCNSSRIIKSPQSGVTLCFQFVSSAAAAAAAAAAAMAFASHSKTVSARP